MKLGRTFLLLVPVMVIALCGRAAGADEQSPWPAPVPGFQPLSPGEHPRLLFRKGELAKLRQRAATPEGQAILKRLRVQLNGGGGSSLAIDFSIASGADAMLVMTGPGAPRDNAVELGGTRVSFLFLTKGSAPTPKVEGDKISVGRQTVGVEQGRIVLAAFGPGEK